MVVWNALFHICKNEYFIIRPGVAQQFRHDSEPNWKILRQLAYGSYLLNDKPEFGGGSSSHHYSFIFLPVHFRTVGATRIYSKNQEWTESTRSHCVFQSKLNYNKQNYTSLVKNLQSICVLKLRLTNLPFP